jgi:hypothetical protein
MALAAADRVYFTPVGVHADDIEAGLSHNDGQRQANVAQTQDGYQSLVFFQLVDQVLLNGTHFASETLASTLAVDGSIQQE